MKPVNLNLGCGVRLAKDFINVDNYFTLKDLKTKKGAFKNTIIEKNSKFVKADIRKLPFKNNFADYIECNDALEHVPIMEVGQPIKEIYRVLKPGGKLVLMTPDFSSVALNWLQEIKPMTTENFDINKYIEYATTIYGMQLGEGEYHRVPISPLFLFLLLVTAGFKSDNIKITCYPRGNRPPVTKLYPPANTSLRFDELLAEATK